MEKKFIYCALTMDVEPNISRIVNKTGDLYTGLTKSTPALLDILKKHEVPFTWFITHDYWGKISIKFPSIVKKMSKIGEIGCHVHFRRKEERYYTDYNFQLELIKNATNSLREQGYPVKSFRGGNLFFNKNTLRVLEELDYEVDSSVSPGLYVKHYDLIVDHRACNYTTPYFPSYDNHCISGNSKILEIPISIYPYFHFKTRFVSFFITKNISIPLTKENYLKTINRIKKIINNNSIVILVLNFHPWNLLGNTEYKLRNIEEFILFLKSFNTRFVTMIELKTWLKSNKEFLLKTEDIKKKSRFIITKFDILKLVKRISSQRRLN